MNSQRSSRLQPALPLPLRRWGACSFMLSYPDKSKGIRGSRDDSADAAASALFSRSEDEEQELTPSTSRIVVWGGFGSDPLDFSLKQAKVQARTQNKVNKLSRKPNLEKQHKTQDEELPVFVMKRSPDARLASVALLDPHHLFPQPPSAAQFNNQTSSAPSLSSSFGDSAPAVTPTSAGWSWPNIGSADGAVAHPPVVFQTGLWLPRRQSLW